MSHEFVIVGCTRGKVAVKQVAGEEAVMREVFPLGRSEQFRYGDVGCSIMFECQLMTVSHFGID